MGPTDPVLDLVNTLWSVVRAACKHRAVLRSSLVESPCPNRKSVISSEMGWISYLDEMETLWLNCTDRLSPPV